MRRGELQLSSIGYNESEASRVLAEETDEETDEETALKLKISFKFEKLLYELLSGTLSSLET